MPPPPQVQPLWQSPHSRVPPQPSPILPQNWPPVTVQVSGTHEALAQTPLVQVSSDAQPPQARLRPQPSPIVPQNLPAELSQVTGVQLGPPTQIFPSQVQSPEQAPHSTASPQASPIRPQYWAPTALQASAPQLAAPAVPLAPPLPIEIEVEPPEVEGVVAPPLVELVVLLLAPPVPVDGPIGNGSLGVGLQLQTETSNAPQARQAAGARTTAIRFITARPFRSLCPAFAPTA
jgi:hypothetical protein